MYGWRIESDRWAFNEDAAMNCLRPGSNSAQMEKQVVNLNQVTSSPFEN